jgi:AAA family ATP:ADP antiporter
MDGITNVIRSPYLLGIFGLMLFFTISSTFIYFQQTDIIAQVFANDRVGRTKLLANRDLVVNVLALLTQLFLTGRIVRWFGIGIALAFLPALGVVGFALLGAWPVLAAVMSLDILRRAANFAIQRPAREALYAVLPRADKYKAKNFNDTFAYRVGDQIGAWSYPAMVWLGLGASALSFSMVPLSVAWLFLALWMGRKYLRLHPTTGTSPRG